MKYRMSSWKGHKAAHVSNTEKERYMVLYMGEWIQKEMTW
jgi:hypothetical protein